MSEISFVRCEAKDWELLREIAEDNFRKTYQSQNDPIHFEKYIKDNFSAEAVKNQIANKSSHFFFVKVGKNIAGYMKLNEPPAHSDLQENESIEIERIYVSEEFKGRGIGRKMIEFSVEFSRKKRFPKIWLGVWDQNFAAIGFYEKVGFQKKGTHTFMMGNDAQIDFIMEKDI